MNNTRILNREGKLPDDGWYQYESLGEHVNHEAKIVQVIDKKAIDAITNRFTADASKLGENFAGEPIDKDHLSDSQENPTEAMGWAMELRVRDQVPEARIDWTVLGRPLVEAKPGQPPAYKFFSTEYNRRDCEKIGERIVGGRRYDVVRPLRLDGLSLTNDPNNKGQRPISNRRGESPDADETPTAESIPMNDIMKALDLSADASEASALEVIQKFKNRATTAEAEVTALKTERDGLLAAQVEADLEKYKNRFKPEAKEKWKSQLIKNRASAIELLDLLPEIAAPARITNRASATPPTGERAPTAEGDEKALADKIKNRANELKGAAPSRSFDSCWNQAQSELATAKAQ